MPEPSVDALVAGVRTRLQDEVTAQLQSVLDAHRREIEDARRAAAADAEERWLPVVSQARAEAQAAAAEAVGAVRAQLDHVHRTNLAHNRALARAATVLEQASSLSAALSAIQDGAREITRDAALVLLHGDTVEGWGSDAAAPRSSDWIPDIRRTRKTLRRDTEVIVPVALDGTIVAALTANAGDAAVVEALEVLTRSAASRLATITALRTLDARGWMAWDRTASPNVTDGANTEPPPDQLDGDLGARRYARLLISEIKMYNEPSVRAGREHRDLARRLSHEIERARQLYEKRVPVSLPDRARHFHEELVRTLADGDPSLLG